MKDSLLERMQASWAAQEAAGCVPRSIEEVEAERRQTRDDGEERMQRIDRIRAEAEAAKGISTELSAGPGEVSPQPMPQFPVGDPFWDMRQSIWADQKARGHVPRSVEEVETERQETRDHWEERLQAMDRLQEESHRSSTTPRK